MRMRPSRTSRRSNQMKKDDYLKRFVVPSSALDPDGCLDTDSPEGQSLARTIEARAHARRQRRARRKLVMLTFGITAAVGTGAVVLIAAPERARRPVPVVIGQAPSPGPSVTAEPTPSPIRQGPMVTAPAATVAPEYVSA